VLVSGAPGPVVAKAEALKGPGGTIPVQLRYATRRLDLGPSAGGAFEGVKLVDGFDFGQTRFLDALSETPVTNEPVQAVWVTVDVPAAASPGQYQGPIVVEGKTVQVSASVSAFIVPPPGERRLHLNAWQSPDSVAARYGVTPWSDAHFKLLEPSLKLAGRMGGTVMYVPVIGRTYFGHRTGLIYFTRQGGELVPDFTAFDRYLDLWIKLAGKPRLVVALVFDVNYRGGRYDANGTIELTVRGENGVFKHVATPIYEKNVKLWKDVMEGMLQRTAKVGLAKYQILLGQSNDVRPFPEVRAVFQAIDPAVGWTAWRHIGGTRKPVIDDNGKTRMGLLSGCSPDPRYTWPRGCPEYLPGPNTTIFLTPLRQSIFDRLPCNTWRLLPDGVAYGDINGYGPLGLDLWSLSAKDVTAEQKLDWRFMHERNTRPWNLKAFGMEYGPNIDRGSPVRLTVAGPHGALSTTRVEAYAEGACETEARLTIDLAVAAKKIDAARARTVEEARYKGFPAGVLDATQFPADWQVSLAALYDLAAEAQKALGDK
jgi:hypothetical protein